jgi:hypothetical protein
MGKERRHSPQTRWPTCHHQIPTDQDDPLGEPIPPSQGESPFPVDFYLSWMSLGFLGFPTALQEMV